MYLCFVLYYARFPLRYRIYIGIEMDLRSVFNKRHGKAAYFSIFSSFQYVDVFVYEYWQ